MEQVSFDLGEVAEEPAEATLSVLELTSGLRDAVRASFPAELWVRGEVQGLRRSQNGHTYFSLVEKSGQGDQVRAKIDVMLWRDDRGRVDKAIKAVPGAELGNDVEVRIRGRVEVYAPQGRMQLKMTAIDPVFTVGDIAAGRERVLRALAADGLLGLNQRRPMPLVPLRIGLVTSAGSAAFHDFVEELAGSGFAFEVGVVDVRVQGANASRRIVYGLRQMAMRDLDVVVLARGGGSRADLAPFDADVVARAIAAMPVPVLCGVGHETDRSVADEVAHTSCKTPTACAQLLVARVRGFAARVDTAAERVVARDRVRRTTAASGVRSTKRRATFGAGCRRCWRGSARRPIVTRVGSRSWRGCGCATRRAGSTTARGASASSVARGSGRRARRSTTRLRSSGRSIPSACSNAGTASRATKRVSSCGGSATSPPARWCACRWPTVRW